MSTRLHAPRSAAVVRHVLAGPALAAVLAVIPMPPPASGSAESDSGRARARIVEAASRTHRVALRRVAEVEDRDQASADQVFLWSRRLMCAERMAARDADARLAAARGHSLRMEDFHRTLSRITDFPLYGVVGVEFYAADAASGEATRPPPDRRAPPPDGEPPRPRQGSGAPPKRGRLPERKVESAKRMYEAACENLSNGPGTPVTIDQVYVWSERWMRSELAAAVNGRERRAALHAHAERMESLHVALKKHEDTVAAAVAASDYYIAEAEEFVRRELTGGAGEVGNE